MTTYRLNLTGEYEGRILADCANVRLQLPDGGTVTVPVELATEVKPPLPPVPDAPAVMVGDQVWARDDVKGEGPVFLLPGGPTLDWAELNGHAAAQGKPIIPLVKDPAADAPELPLRIEDDGGNLIARAEDSDAYEGRLFVDIEYEHLRREHVRQVAAAMWAWAAREAGQP